MQSQAAMEEEFWKYFGDLVSEWNPCFTEGGTWRYKWDSEVGAHDVDAELDPLDEEELAGFERDAFAEREALRTSEAKAVRAVSAREPDRVNLRDLLDKVFGARTDAECRLDVQRVRRLVAALVDHDWLELLLEGPARLGPCCGVSPCCT